MRAQDPRFPLFDSLRAIAALSVVAFHLAFFTGHFGRFAAQLNIGVPIFFLVSAFLLYRPFVRARLAGDPPLPTGPYALRRALRIVPAYWVLVIVGGIVLGLSVVDSLGKILTYLTFTQVYDNTVLFGGNGLGHAWTLCVEVTFYALLPIWAWVMRRGLPELPALAVLFLFGVVWNVWVVGYDVAGFAELSWRVATLPAYLDQFALGMALAVVSVMKPELRLPPAWTFWLAAAAGYVVVCLIAPHAGRAAALATHELRGLVGLALLIPAVWGEGGWVRALLARRELLWVGVVSYGLYLWHPPIMRKLLDAGMSGVPYALVSIALSLAAAAASWYLVERPIIRLGRRS